MVIELWLSKKTPVLEDFGLRLRLPRRKDFADWQNVRAASRGFLTPVEPKWSEYELTKKSFLKRVKISSQRASVRTEISLFIFVLETKNNKPEENFVGGITLSNIRYGAACHANLGYWLGVSQTNNGYMGKAIKLLLPYAFGPLKLRRIHAACLPDNSSSKKVLVKTGFKEEGFARDYLQINGKMRDHLLYGMTKGSFSPIK